MNDKIYKLKIAKLVEDIKEQLFMKKWKITVKFTNKQPNPGEHGYHLADIRADFTYSTAIITVYPALKKEHSNDWKTIEESILHEMIHCLTEELYFLARARYVTPPEVDIANERLVQHITRAIKWNYEPNKKTAKKA